MSAYIITRPVMTAAELAATGALLMFWFQG